LIRILWEKYRSELIAFRNHLELFILDLENTPKSQLVERKQRFIQSSEEQRQSIYENMNSSFADVTLGTFCSLLSAILPAAAAITTNNPGALGLSVPGLLNVIHSVYKSNELRCDPTQPLAYAAYIEKRFNKKTRHLGAK